MSSFKVTKCVCSDITFEKVKEIASVEGYSTIEELQTHDISCTSCGLCEPYLEITLETGQTEFEPGEYLNKKSN